MRKRKCSLKPNHLDIRRSKAQCLYIEVDDAIEIAEKFDV